MESYTVLTPTGPERVTAEHPRDVAAMFPMFATYEIAILAADGDLEQAS